MFVTSQLNTLSQLIVGHNLSGGLSDQLQQDDPHLEAKLLRAKVLRHSAASTVHYMIQPQTQKNTAWASVFAPFILANLNKPVIYQTCQASSGVKFLNLDRLKDRTPQLTHHETLRDLGLFLQFALDTRSESDFIYAALLQALCHAEVSCIVLMTDLPLDPIIKNQLEAFFKVTLLVLSCTDDIRIDLEQIELRQLLFKQKDAYHAALCTAFSRYNAEILQAIGLYSLEQGCHLVEDMFYAEHLYEKISVYSEYMQTRWQNAPLLCV